MALLTMNNNLPGLSKGLQHEQLMSEETVAAIGTLAGSLDAQLGRLTQVAGGLGNGAQSAEVSGARRAASSTSSDASGRPEAPVESASHTATAFGGVSGNAASTTRGGAAFQAHAADVSTGAEAENLSAKSSSRSSDVTALRGENGADGTNGNNGNDGNDGQDGTGLPGTPVDLPEVNVPDLGLHVGTGASTVLAPLAEAAQLDVNLPGGTLSDVVEGLINGEGALAALVLGGESDAGSALNLGVQHTVATALQPVSGLTVFSPLGLNSLFDGSQASLSVGRTGGLNLTTGLLNANLLGNQPATLQPNMQVVENLTATLTNPQEALSLAQQQLQELPQVLESTVETATNLLDVEGVLEDPASLLSQETLDLGLLGTLTNGDETTQLLDANGNLLEGEEPVTVTLLGEDVDIPNLPEVLEDPEAALTNVEETLSDALNPVENLLDTGLLDNDGSGPETILPDLDLPGGEDVAGLLDVGLLPEADTLPENVTEALEPIQEILEDVTEDVIEPAINLVEDVTDTVADLLGIPGAEDAPSPISTVTDALTTITESATAPDNNDNSAAANPVTQLVSVITAPPPLPVFHGLFG